MGGARGIAVMALGLLMAGCPSSKYADLPDAPAAVQQGARKLWAGYLEALGKTGVDKRPELLAGFFCKPLVAGLAPDDFAKAVAKALRKRSAGLFEAVEVTAVKQPPEGLILLLDSKAGEVALPLVEEDGRLKFAALDPAVGDWTGPLKRAPAELPAEPSLLYIRMLLADEQAPVGERLRAAVSLAESRYRGEILRAKKTVANPVVQLGLGLARIKIDGSDEAFVTRFPAEAAALSALRKADPAIFEEMLVKLTHLGAMVEDPPANEALYRATVAAPADLKERFGRALYEMAEENPRRLVFAVFNLCKDMDSDPALAAYFGEVGRHSGQAPKALAFMKKCSRQGEPRARKLCSGILAQFRKHG